MQRNKNAAVAMWIMVLKTDGPKLSLGEALIMALPFLALLLSYGLTTDKIQLDRWPLTVEMRAGLWIPIVFCAMVYGYLLLNLYEKRKGDWKWFREGLISAVILIILWSMLSPVFERSLWMTEQNKVGLSHPQLRSMGKQSEGIINRLNQVLRVATGTPALMRDNSPIN